MIDQFYQFGNVCVSGGGAAAAAAAVVVVFCRLLRCDVILNAANAARRSGSEVYDVSGHKDNNNSHNIGNIPASSPGSFFGPGRGAGAPQTRYQPTPNTPTSSLGYDTFGTRSPRSQLSLEPASPAGPGPDSTFTKIGGSSFESPTAVAAPGRVAMAGREDGGGGGPRGLTKATMGFQAGGYDNFYTLSLGGKVTFGTAADLAWPPPCHPRPASAGRGRGPDAGIRGNKSPPPSYARRRAGGGGSSGTGGGSSGTGGGVGGVGGGGRDEGGDVDGSSLGYSPFVPTGSSVASLTSSEHTGRAGRAGHGRSGSGTPPVARIFGVKADVAAAPKEGANGDANGRRIDKGKAPPRATPAGTGSFGSGGSGGSGSGSSTPKVGFLPPPSGEERRGEERRGGVFIGGPRVFGGLA